MVTTKQLSRNGHYDIEFILSQEGISPDNSGHICYEALKQIGELPKLVKEQGHDYTTWTSFSKDINPDTWKMFFHQRQPVSEDTYDAFCTLISHLDPCSEFEGEAARTYDLNRPSEAQDTFRACQNQINCLLKVAEERLLLEDRALEKQLESYKNSLGIKNKEFLIEPDHEYQLEEDHIDYELIPSSNNSPILKIRLNAKVYFPGHAPTEVIWGVAMVNTKTGRSELLLDNRPFVWAGHEVKVGSHIIRRVRLPKGIQLTARAIHSLQEACRKHPGEQRVSNFGGWLKDTNLTIFKHEYLKLKREGGRRESDIQREALLKTPFGKARNRMGISEFKIRIVERCDKEIPKTVLVESACYPRLQRVIHHTREVLSAKLMHAENALTSQKPGVINRKIS